MSADNGIYILVTKDSHKKTSEHCWTNTFDEGVIAFRVAHAQAIDNLGWYEKNQPYNVGHFLYTIFGESEPIYDEAEAVKQAFELQDAIGYTEYGVSKIIRTQYVFPW